MAKLWNSDNEKSCPLTEKISTGNPNEQKQFFNIEIKHDTNLLAIFVLFFEKCWHILQDNRKFSMSFIIPGQHTACCARFWHDLRKPCE